MLNSENYEILVLGSGEAGKFLAWSTAKAGRRTAMVERSALGGSCPNVACLPSKNPDLRGKGSFAKRAGLGIRHQNGFADR